LNWRYALATCALVFPVYAQITPFDPSTAGPALLTRGQAPTAMISPQIDLRPFVELTGIYDTGLSGVVVNDQGQLANAAAAGMELDGGISGVHSWKHTTIGLDYRGTFRQYNQQTYYDGTDQSLMLGITQQLSKHATLAFRESAGLFSRNVSLNGLNQTVPFDPSSSYIPSTDFFDNRTIYGSTLVDLTLQKSSRLSFDFGGDGFLARRRSTALYGTTGGAARGDVQYRVTRRTTVGTGYTFTHFDFTGVFSGTDVHTAIGSYAVRLTERLEFTSYAGVERAETKFIQSVPVDPVVAALLGSGVGNVVIHNIDWSPTANGRLSQTFQNGVLYVAGGHTVTPGNGLFLTSRMTSVMAGYAYTGLRRWSFNSEATAGLGKSIGNVIGAYNTYAGTLTVSRHISGAFSAVASFSARRYDSPDFANYRRTVYTTRIGIGFSPGDVPLRVW
jgi:hypothetical protein